MSDSRFSSPIQFFEETISSVSDSPVPSSIQHEDTFSFSDPRFSFQNQFEDTLSTLSTDAYDEPPSVVIPDGALTSGETSAADLSVGSDACIRPIPILKPGPEGQPSGTTTTATGLPSQRVEDTDSTNSHTMDMSLVSDSSFSPVPSAAPVARAASPSTSSAHSARRHTSHSARSSVSNPDPVYRQLPFLRGKKSSSSASSASSASSERSADLVVDPNIVYPQLILLQEEVTRLKKERGATLNTAISMVQSMGAAHEGELASCKEEHAKILKSRDEELEQLKEEHAKILKSRDEELKKKDDEHARVLKSRDEKLEQLKEEHAKILKSRDEAIKSSKKSLQELMVKYLVLSDSHA
ncbi:hypothetical protein ONZ45_g5643 [Pleurotus djamor]|nr:hypothetical protein ONZ45_g5643 [Pleurotus djamor]